MSNGIDAEVGNKATTIDIMEWLARGALELIGQGGLGISMDSLGDPTRNPLADSVKMMMWGHFYVFGFRLYKYWHISQCHSPSIADLSELQFFFQYVKYLGPSWVKQTLARLAPSPTIQRLRKAVHDVEAESKKILAGKRAGLKAGDEETVNEFTEKRDVMSILRMSFLPPCFMICGMLTTDLVQANMNASEADRLPEDELVAQVS